jgi:ribonucleoside-diphosphate reductase alpha chain
VLLKQNEIFVQKRDGRKELLDIDKIHRQVMWATEGLSGVSASEVEIRSQLQFYPGIKTVDIQETLIKAAADLISEENPNYQYVAGRLINYHIRKEVYDNHIPISLHQHVKNVVKLGYYDEQVLDQFSDDEWKTLDTFIDHDRDYEMTYAAMEQWRGKYLVKNRVTGQLFETPQMAYILIAAVLFAKYPANTRMKWIKDYYDAISTHDISLPTPVMAGVRTPQRQFSSCVLIECDDSIDSINATSAAIVKYVSQKAGIGINAGKIRALGSPIRKGDAYHTGIVPFIKLFQSAVKSCNQGGIRGGAATLYYPFWHLEFEDLVVLKNNKGTEENRARHMDYGVQFNKLAYERLLSGGNITLFSPSDVPGLYDAFYSDQAKFKTLYEAAERNTKLRKKTLKAIDVFTAFMQERKNTGRIYLMNVDHANTHSSFIESVAPVRQSNLCLTGNTELKIRHTDGKEETISLAAFVERWQYGGMHGVQARSYDTATNIFVWADVSDAAKTATVTELIEIEDESGKIIRCTPDHQIWTKNRGWVMAKNLLETDVLCTEI